MTSGCGPPVPWIIILLGILHRLVFKKRTRFCSLISFHPKAKGSGGNRRAERVRKKKTILKNRQETASSFLITRRNTKSRNPNPRRNTKLLNLCGSRDSVDSITGRSGIRKPAWTRDSPLLQNFQIDSRYSSASCSTTGGVLSQG
jgi:hypothetical protein